MLAAIAAILNWGEVPAMGGDGILAVSMRRQRGVFDVSRTRVL